MFVSVDNEIHVSDAKKEKASINKKRKNKDKSLVGKRKPKGEEVGFEEKSGELNVMYGVWASAICELVYILFSIVVEQLLILL